MASQIVELQNEFPCPTEKNVFLSNYKNKESFVVALSKQLELHGFKVHLCPSDADTTTIRVAFDYVDRTPVTVYSDDTDVLCSLVHHAIQHDCLDIFVTNITIEKNCQQKQFYRIRDIAAEVNIIVLKYLLFTHALIGCNTTSAIHKFGKISIFGKLKSSSLRSIANVFYEDDVSPDKNGRALIRFFKLLNSSTYNLPQIWTQTYEEMVMSIHSYIDPALLPSSP